MSARLMEGVASPPTAWWVAAALLAVWGPVCAAECMEGDAGYWCFADDSERASHFGYERWAQDEEEFSVTVHQVDIARFPVISVYTSVLDSVRGVVLSLGR